MKKQKKTIEKMISVFCQGNHKSEQLCEQCRNLLSYAHMKLDKCPFQERKTSCSKCEIHCYEPIMRQQIKKVMRYAGPRMIYKDPAAVLKHLFK